MLVNLESRVAKGVCGYFSTAQHDILNKCDKKVLCVYIGPREIVYRRLPAVAKEGRPRLVF
jgi:hypothetical protein